MSLNFDVKSNLSLVRRFHTMEKLQKCVNFILTVPVFFCNQLYLLRQQRVILYPNPLVVDQKNSVETKNATLDLTHDYPIIVIHKSTFHLLRVQRHNLVKGAPIVTLNSQQFFQISKSFQLIFCYLHFQSNKIRF
jgi:hypothetical protein